MVREVIHIQVGQCGNQIGNKFWETISYEHGINPEGKYVGNNSEELEKVNVYYHETQKKRFIPRALLIDTERSILEWLTVSKNGHLYRPKNFICSKNGATNCFFEGCYSEESNRLCKETMERVRYELEHTHCCQGFTFSHNSGGGTGSGLTMKIHAEIKELLHPTYAGCWFYTVFPSQKISNTVLEPYNTVLLLEKQMEAKDVVCFDNESLNRICFDTLGITNPSFADMNRLVAMTMSGLTASFRFPGQINTDMNKLSISLRCRPFLHYYIPSFAPLNCMKTRKYKKVTVSELVRQMTAEENQMLDCVPDLIDIDNNPGVDISGCCFAYAALFRGKMSSQHVDEALSFLKGDQTLENDIRKNYGYEERANFILEKLKNCQKYHPHNPRPTFNTITNNAPSNIPLSATYLRNTSAVKHKFVHILRQAKAMYDAGSFLTWYDKAQYSMKKIDMSLENCMEKMRSEFIINFGIEDQSQWPSNLLQEKLVVIAPTPIVVDAPKEPAEDEDSDE